MESRRNRRKNEDFDAKNTEIGQNLPDSGPKLTPEGATETFGTRTTAFLEALCALVAEHGIEGVMVTILHQGVIRTASAGANPAAAQRAKEIALQVADGLSRLAREEVGRAVR
jgi:hypothetical protein